MPTTLHISILIKISLLDSPAAAQYSGLISNTAILTQQALLFW